ncbi:MAG: ATP-binding cassette domain-containing protein [Planctomycetota bacterium]
MQNAVLEVNDLVKVFGETRAVDGLSFRVEAGQIFALLGPNGAGKSTTIRCLTTLLAPTSGTISVCGHDVAREPDQVRTCLGYVPQELALDRYLTGREHLELSARLYRLPRREAQARIAELLDVVELSDRADDAAKTYSGGMKKRLDLACGLLHRPQLLVLDEPTLGLDVQTRHRIWAFVSRLRESGTTVLMTTHYLDEADQLADRIAVIDHGTIVAQGTAQELKQGFGGQVLKLEVAGDPALSEAQWTALRGLPGVSHAEPRGKRLLFVCDDAQAVVAPLTAWLEGEGLGLASLSFGPPGLDDVFLKLTGHGLRD